MKIFFGLVVAAMLGGCVAVPPYGYYGEQYQMAPLPQVQYAPQQVAPVYVPVYRPQYYIAPMYGGYYGAPMMYTDPFLSFRFNFNFGKGGKHHGGGHRR